MFHKYHMFRGISLFGRAILWVWGIQKQHVLKVYLEPSDHDKLFLAQYGLKANQGKIDNNIFQSYNFLISQSKSIMLQWSSNQITKAQHPYLHWSYKNSFNITAGIYPDKSQSFLCIVLTIQIKKSITHKEIRLWQMVITKGQKSQKILSQ